MDIVLWGILNQMRSDGCSAVQKTRTRSRSGLQQHGVSHSSIPPRESTASTRRPRGLKPTGATGQQQNDPNIQLPTDLKKI